MNKIIYPSVCTGKVLTASNDSITFAGQASTLTIHILNSNLFDEFNTGDTIYYSYALSKSPFGTMASSVRVSWYDIDNEVDVPN